MRTFTKLFSVALLATSALAASSASATVIPDGTVTVAALYNPVVKLTTAPATYTATLGSTFEVIGTGGFASATGKFGTMNGALEFSSTVGDSIDQALANFFVFSDGSATGTYNFSVERVTTQSYAFVKGVSSSISLFLLGSTVDVAKGLTATPTSLTLSFNSTSNSPYAASATLAVPPIGSVPEPISWAMMVGGFGMVGAAMRARRRTSVTFA